MRHHNHKAARHPAEERSSVSKPKLTWCPECKVESSSVCIRGTGLSPEEGNMLAQTHRCTEILCIVTGKQTFIHIIETGYSLLL